MADSKAQIVVSAEDRTSRVFAGIKANLGAVRAQAEQVNQGFIGLNTTLVGAFSVVGLASFLRNVVDGVDKLNDLSDATGSSVENLSGLEDIAARTGTSVDTVGSAVTKLNKNLVEAQDPTSKAAGLFRQLGLDVGELSKLDPSQALLRVSTALAGFADGASKGQFQLALLGKSTRELAPFLKDLAEAGEINATVTTKQAQEAEKFNQELFKLSKNATDVARAVAGPLVSSINTAIESFRQASKEGKSFREIISNQFSRSSQEALFFGTGKPPEQQKRRPANEGGGRFNLPELQAPVDTPKPTRGGGGAAKDLTTDAQRYLENLQRQLQATKDLSVAETVLADIQAGRLKLAKGESAQPLLDIAAQIDQAKRLQEQLKAEAEQVRELRAEQQQLRSAGAAVFEATRTPREKLTADLEELRNLLAKGAIDTETYYRRVQQLDDAFQELGKNKETINELDEYTVRAAQNIQDSLGDELFNVLDGNFKNVGDSLKRTLDRMVAEAIAADINNAIFGGASKSSGGGSKALFDGLLNIGLSAFDSGGGTYNGSKGGINGGSIIKPNSLRGGAATGSNMLERDMITLLHKGEAIVPKEYNPAAGGMGRSVNVTVNQTFAANTSRQTTMQAAADARRALEMAARNV